MYDSFVYVRNFFRDKHVSSITPTSLFGVKKVCSEINFDKTGLIVEYGPGTGVFTKHLLKNMNTDSRLIVIERNKNFNSILERTVRDPRITIVNDSAENVLDALSVIADAQADYILSGIPFFWLRDSLKHRILYNTRSALKEGGKFLVYQTCFQTDQHLKVHLERFFPIVRTRFEIRNIPPLRIYEAVNVKGTFRFNA